MSEKRRGLPRLVTKSIPLQQPTGSATTSPPCCNMLAKLNITSEHDWVKRGIREALFIKALKPSINIDPGRHALSCHFDSILETVISAPPAPTTHNGETETLINTAPRRQGRPRKLPASSNDTHVKTVDSQPQPQQQQQPPQPQQPQLPMRQSQRIRSRQQQEQ